MRAGTLFVATVLGIGATGAGAPAYAGFGQPSPWQTGLQQADTTVMNSIISFNDALMYFVIGIGAFVFLMLVVAMVRFNKHVHPVASKRTGNPPLEVAWTVVPFLIVLVLIAFSYRLLYFELDVPKSDLTIKATGHQWYWQFSYPDSGNFQFVSNMLRDGQRKPGQPRLLSVDNELVVPVDKVVRVEVIGSDVIHSFAVPSFGIKVDAVPGRLNTTWFKATRTGMYYGQCSELCGMDHSFMPIAIRVVTAKEFADWLGYAKVQYAARPVSPPEATASIDTGAGN
jgi:cytochrome c oxidase subunit II